MTAPGIPFSLELVFSLPLPLEIAPPHELREPPPPHKEFLFPSGDDLASQKSGGKEILSQDPPHLLLPKFPMLCHWQGEEQAPLIYFFG